MAAQPYLTQPDTDRWVVGCGLVATLIGFLAIVVVATLVLLYFIPE
ncbi:MAG: hypothetical protein ACI8W8_001459 [Rhodothermales bacterium]|jgi:hypothetical protein